MRTTSGYTRAVLRQWPIVIAAVLLGMIGGFIYSKVATPVYSSSSQVLIAVASSGTTADRLQGANYIDQVIPTYTSAVTSSTVLSPVGEQLTPRSSASALAADVSAKQPTGTAIITITATASTAERAHEIVSLVTARFLAVAPGLVSPVSPTAADSATAAQLAQAGNVPANVALSVVDDPTTPQSPDSPRLPLGLALGLIAGLLVGIAVALCRFAVDRRVRSLSRIEEIVGAPVVGRLPVIAARGWASREDDPAWVESVGGIRSALFAWGDPVRTIQFCSSTPGEGTTSTVTALAASLARAGVRTVAVDADLRSSALAASFDVAARPGLADVLTGTSTLSDASKSSPGLPRLLVVPAGENARAGDLMATNLAPMLDELAGIADIVLVDTPPLESASDALAISHAVSDTILVVAFGGVTEQVLRRTVEQLANAGRAVRGIIVTRAERSTLNESSFSLAPSARA